MMTPSFGRSPLCSALCELVCSRDHIPFQIMSGWADHTVPALYDEQKNGALPQGTVTRVIVLSVSS